MSSPWTDRYPFISFEFDINRLGPTTWMKIGEALSKCQHIAGAPLKPDRADELSAVYLARGAQATTAIEGNTLSDEEVMNVVKHGTGNVPESRAYLEREVANVIGAIRNIDDALLRGDPKKPITRDRLCELDYKVLEGIPDEPRVVPGKLREHDVTVGPYKAPHYTDVPELVDQFVAWLRDLRGPQGSDRPPEERFTSALLSAVLAHLYIAWIHPFGNGNGRTARLVEVQILSESGVVPLVATNILSDFYNKTRSAYYLALSEAQHDVGAFISYAVTGFLDELRAQIREITDANLAVQWESYVYEVFNNRPNTEARGRQREVALCLPSERFVTPEQMTDLTPSLARKYARCGERTPVRDLNELVNMELVQRAGRRRYRARREVIQAFIPPVSD
jgi:Fic family protein